MTTSDRDRPRPDGAAVLDEPREPVGPDDPDSADGEAVRGRSWWSGSLPGAWGAMLFVVASLAPSLLPRNGVTQGLLTGISAATGYGLGVLLALLWRSFADRAAREPSPMAWRVFAIVAVVLVVAALVFGWAWQRDLRELMGASAAPVWLTLLTPVVAFVIFVLLVGVCRAIQRLARWLVRQLEQWIGPRPARTLGWSIALVTVYLVATGVLLDGLVGLADSAFSLRDTTTDEGVEPPQDAERAGSPASSIAWDTLGRQGRNFAAGGPTAEEIAAFTGDDALTPVRVYAGIATAEDVEARAQHAVDDLMRAGGFDRAALLVATTTGTGWLDPGSIASFEYLNGGDSAIVTMQYSYLPSWISYLVDQDRASAAGRELFDAVYERWVRLPDDARPALYVFGESLGSFGAETAFSGEYDLRNRTHGALFSGPPGFNPLHHAFTTGRDAGSRQVEPVYRSGRTVRFANDITAGAEPVDAPWDGSRVLYLQHPSDPIVWWGPELMLNRPDWLREEPGRDVLDQMVWVPFVTFWQVTVDLPFAVAMPPGHGHRYTHESVDGWATVLQIEDWDETRADALRALVVPPADRIDAEDGDG